MKKIFTLIALMFLAFGFTSKAQTTTCNANFTWQLINGNTATFTPALNDSPSVHHTWSFGDGGFSTAIYPVHSYAANGAYTVMHRTIRYNPNNVPTCIDSSFQVITIQQTTCNLVANFSWTATAGNPLTLEFHNLSVPLEPTDSITWSFGDGTPNSYVVNAVHTYANAGTYQVCLVFKKNNTAPGMPTCVRYICKPVVVSIPCNLAANFTSVVSPTNSMAFQFTNTTVPLAATDSILWSFGDGTSSTQISPLHTYANAGTYNVCLRVKKVTPAGGLPCVSEICRAVVVTLPCNIVANFTWQASTANSQTIIFTNTSTPLAITDSISWNFGDGVFSSQVSPTHTYTIAGTYNVCLRIYRYNAAGTQPCVREICKSVVVTSTCNFQAAYSWRLDSLNARKVYFTNLTLVPVTSSVTWTFGDGTTANTWNAIHEYAQPGRYAVCLRVETGANCVRYSCDSITIPAPIPPCNNQSNFTAIASSAANQNFVFTPAYQSASVVYTWTFGDGTGSHDMIATHHYNASGFYTVCLTVWRSSTCASTTCNVVFVNTQLNCDSVHVNYSFQRDPVYSNKLYFVANSNFTLLDQTWTFQKMNGTSGGTIVTVHQNNPTYVFGDTGYYRVCLRAVTVGNCVKEYCSIIHIGLGGVTNGCFLQAYPNPASGNVNANVVLSQAQTITATVYNSNNAAVLTRVQQGFVGSNIITFNVAALPAGMYTIRFTYGTQVCYALFQKI